MQSADRSYKEIINHTNDLEWHSRNQIGGFLPQKVLRSKKVLDRDFVKVRSE